MEEKKSSTSANDYTLEDVKREVAQEVQKKEQGKRIQLIIFKLGDEEYGLSIDQIKEVVITPRIATIPQTPSYIKGVANIRGNIIAIMDLEDKFNLNKKAITELSGYYTLVLESEKYKVGILVNDVPNTLAVYSNDIDNASSFVQYSTLDDSSITGVVKSGNRMIIMIDLLTMIEKENINITTNKAN